MTTTCASCGFFFQVTAPSPRCPSCGAAAPGGFAPPPMGGVPGQAPYAPGHPGGHGPGAGQAYGPSNVPRDLDVGWLLWGAIAMVFCCQPFGIAAFIFMDQAKSAYRSGDDARAAAKVASMRTSVTIGIGLAALIVLLYVGILAVGIGAAILGSA